MSGAFGDTPDSEHGLGMAAGVATRKGRSLVICLVARDLDHERQLHSRAGDLLSEAAAVARYRSMPELKAPALGPIRREEGVNQVIGSIDAQPGEAVGLCDRTPISLILLR